MTSPNTTTDPSSSGAFDNSRQGVSDAQARAGSPAPSTGLDDIDDALAKHSDKTKTELDDSKKTLEKSSKGIKDITDGDKQSAARFKGGSPSQAPMGPQTAPAAYSGPAPAAMPASTPAAMPAAAATPSAAPIPASMRPISPQALASLLSNAGVTPQSATEAMAPGRHIGTGAKQPLSDVNLAKTGRGVLSPAELRVAIDKAADAAGIPADKAVRAKWHALYRFLIFHESGNNADIIQTVNDVNLSGATAADGGPANAARGLCQVVPNTFKAHHVAGTSDNIFDPVANIAASMNYIMDRYDVERERPGEWCK
ncbi:transglycosylase SLT domain-containing protein [Mycolicibacterium goodii]|uniref:transglycosylase SLT domain-containing protein n=1 Tax=Mycolicibacterium goodii TaxID=134601 RepID=UPI001BDD9F45|nr:transglycosylase SLT domain-containing protein [Mycolicibacterium goodii]MBU8821133.1 transglycosylase SLT domain-containing protein [Mycolicibacterium goodii]